MPVNPATLDSDTPETFDGRRYPEHLRAYESLDEDLLPLARELGEFTFDDLAIAIENPKARAAAPRWLASAEWRGLVERRDASMTSPRVYALTPRGFDRAF